MTGLLRYLLFIHVTGGADNPERTHGVSRQSDNYQLLNDEFPQRKDMLRHAAKKGRQGYCLTFGEIFGNFPLHLHTFQANVLLYFFQ